MGGKHSYGINAAFVYGGKLWWHPSAFCLAFFPWHSWSYFKRFEANLSKISNKWHSILSTQLDTYPVLRICDAQHTLGLQFCCTWAVRRLFPLLSFLLCSSWILPVLICLDLFLGKVWSLSMFNFPIDVSLARRRGLQWGHLPPSQFPLWQMVCFSTNFSSSLIYFWMLCPCTFFPFIFARPGTWPVSFKIKWTLVLRLGCLFFFIPDRLKGRY